jgi:secreted PhoX family phosphatase
VAAGSSFKTGRRAALLGGVAFGAAAAGARAQSSLGGTLPASLGGTLPASLGGTLPASGTVSPPPADAQAPRQDDTVGAGFTRTVVARWGDAVLPGTPHFTPAALTPAQAQTQFPYDAVIVGLITPPASDDGIARLIAVFANPDAPARMLFAGGVDIPAIAGLLQGATVLNLQWFGGRWAVADGGYQSRRLDDGTLCQISGPVAAHIGSTVQGIIAPQAGCVAPWGRVLLGEGDAAPWIARLSGVGLGYGDPTAAPRFGWMVEFDATDPGAIPVKRTALGRFARAGVAAALTADGRPVVFMTQDAAAGLLFRFVAAAAAANAGQLDAGALDTGTLSVAKTVNTGIDWIDLGGDIPSLAAAAAAGRAAGGTVFDAPGGLAIAPQGAALYLACAGDASRITADALNPRTGSAAGHIIAFTPPGGDLAARHFPGAILALAGNPATDPTASNVPGSNAWFTKPRRLNLDPQGALWIGTDQGGIVSATADGVFIMQTAGPSIGMISLAYLAPIGAALGGVAFDKASGTSLAAVRHPGATPTASFQRPATRWPSLSPAMPPQTTIIGLHRPR